MKYIVSFTTSPKRIGKCQIMLKSILSQSKQPDLVILNIPKVFARTGETYNVPQIVSQNCVVNVCDTDYAPATKIVPTIKYLNEKGYNKDNTRIIYLDDDISYMKKMIEAFDEVSSDNDYIWCVSGFNFYNLNIIAANGHGRRCDIAEGYGGVCVKLSCFEDDFVDYINKYMIYPEIKLSDDVLISNYFHLKGRIIKILDVKDKCSRRDMWLHGCILDYGNQTDALHLGADNTSDTNTSRYKRAIYKFNVLKERYFPLYFVHNNAILVK